MRYSKPLTVAADFTKISGLQLSNSKTELMIIGPDNGLTKYAEDKGLKVVKCIKFVGCWIFPYQGEVETNFNFDSVLSKVRLAYRSWAWRKLTPIGAALVCKSLVVSLAIHIMQNFNPTPDWISETYKLLRKLVCSDCA